MFVRICGEKVPEQVSVGRLNQAPGNPPVGRQARRRNGVCAVCGWAGGGRQCPGNVVSGR